MDRQNYSRPNYSRAVQQDSLGSSLHIDKQKTIEKILSLSHVDIFIKKQLILENISLTIKQGELLFITGPTGAGKTSLLNFIAGQKSYKYQGRVESRLTPKEKSKLFVGRVHQDLKVFKNQTVQSNLEFAYDRSIYPSYEKFQRQLHEYCQLFKIDDRLDKKIIEANGGLKQKVAIIRALLAKPDVLLADEPTSALDKVSSMQVFEVLNFLNMKKGMTVVWTSHNRELIKNFRGRIIHLDHGKIVYSGQACFI